MHDALSHISRFLHANARDLGVAGTEDKCGVTVQRISLKRGNWTVEDVWRIASSQRFKSPVLSVMLLWYYNFEVATWILTDFILMMFVVIRVSLDSKVPACFPDHHRLFKTNTHILADQHTCNFRDEDKLGKCFPRYMWRQFECWYGEHVLQLHEKVPHSDQAVTVSI